MWYEGNYRRHLCDMHIDDWDPAFLSEFSADEYFKNLKKAKITNAMIYFQSHVGLCYFPTKSGKMHNAFSGREDMIKKLVDMCRADGIAVTGYYSLIYNNYAHDTHPEWRMLDTNGKSYYEQNKQIRQSFAKNDRFRYGLCCPNNPGYRAFVKEQIKEMSEYFTVDGMFFDMLVWSHLCYCDHCKKRWADEVGGKLPEKADWSDKKWLLHMQKRREWMGEFAQLVTDEQKKRTPGVTVEHNFACAVLPGAHRGIAEQVNNACDYVGGDLYGGIYRQSFTCKFYDNITKHKPFEYMFGRVEGTLSNHTLTKSEDVMLSQVFLTAAHHGATLVIDAIDPVGTMDERVYERIGKVFDKVIPYEKYFKGEMLADIGIYYTLRSKFNAHEEIYTNHDAAVNTLDTFIFANIPSAVTGGWDDLNKYKIVIASGLTEEDSYDFDRIDDYVKNGGYLYISGSDCMSLISRFFNAEYKGRTNERITYIAPEKGFEQILPGFNKKYPLLFEGTAPILKGFKPEQILSTIVLPYTDQDEERFASIHSNPPGIITDIPAMAVTTYGKGKVFWCGPMIEQCEIYHYRNTFLNILNCAFDYKPAIASDAPKDVEIVTFKDKDALYISTVALNEDYKARKTGDFYVSVATGKAPASVVLLPEETVVEYSYDGEKVSFKSENPGIFNMYKINF